jgi:hypothetical protein
MASEKYLIICLNYSMGSSTANEVVDDTTFPLFS